MQAHHANGDRADTLYLRRVGESKGSSTSIVDAWYRSQSPISNRYLPLSDLVSYSPQWRIIRCNTCGNRVVIRCNNGVGLLTHLSWHGAGRVVDEF